jgi:hypothetical protein
MLKIAIEEIKAFGFMLPLSKRAACGVATLQ